MNTQTTEITTTTNESSSRCVDHLFRNAMNDWLFVGFLSCVSLLLTLGPIYAFSLLIILMASFVLCKAFELRGQMRLGEVVLHRPSMTVPASFLQHPVSIHVVDVSSLLLRTFGANEPVRACEICLDYLDEGDEVARSANPECMHEFHFDCIRQSLKRRTTCPCCRREYLSPQNEAIPIADIVQGLQMSLSPSLNTEEQVIRHLPMSDYQLSESTEQAPQVINIEQEASPIQDAPI
jgi:hypothetical protein